MGRSRDTRSFQSFSGLTTRSNSADNVRELANQQIDAENDEGDWSEGMPFDPSQLIDGLNFEGVEGEEDTDQPFDPYDLHQAHYPAPRIPAATHSPYPSAHSKTPTMTTPSVPLPRLAEYETQDSGDAHSSPSFEDEIAEKHWNDDQHGEDYHTPKDLRSLLPEPIDDEPIHAFPTRLDQRTPADTTHQTPQDDPTWNDPPMPHSNGHAWPRGGHRLDGLETVPEEGFNDEPVSPPLAPLTPGGHLHMPEMPLPLNDNLRNRYAPVEEAGRTHPREGRVPPHDLLRRNDLANVSHYSCVLVFVY